MPAAEFLPSELSIEIVSGSQAILSRSAEVAAFLRGSPQQKEVLDLAYFLDRPGRPPVATHLVLLYSAQQLSGAVLLNEFVLPFFRRKIYSTLSRQGHRAVFGPVEHRTAIATAVSDSLLQHGAWFLSIDYELGPMPATESAAREDWLQAAALAGGILNNRPGRRTEWSLQGGAKRSDLPLAATFLEAIEPFGKRTRRNFRYYSRLAVRELGAIFSPSYSIDQAAFLQMNRNSMFPVRTEVAQWRHASLTRFPNMFLAALHTPGGLCLALLGGRRIDTAVEIDWQMNHRDYSRYSLSVTMRALLIEYEVARGSKSLSFEGGSPHPMVDSFQLQSVYNLAVRRSFFAWPWIERLAVKLAAGTPIATTLSRRRRWFSSRSSNLPAIFQPLDVASRDEDESAETPPGTE